jgi:hypothetical protein
MKLLLDECVVHDLKRDLIGHDVSTVVEAGFGGLENGELLLPGSMMRSSPSITICLSSKTFRLFNSES